ncbi:MAG: hypothetical protein ACLUVL_08695 [Oscillospiraceae bacterium]
MQQGIFEKSITVTPDYCDAAAQLSPLAAFTIFQGIAAQHAELSAAQRWRSAASSG